jgi:3-hydroxyacyl-CoA dehydrogenase
MTGGQLHVAVIGAGEVGRGWAALCVAQGWTVALYDVEERAVDEAEEEVGERARALTLLRRADATAVETGMARFTVARSLLQACGEAEWVIEAGPEDLLTKQKMFEAIEAVAGKARAVTSSTSGLPVDDLAARCFRKGRCMIAHPLNPPELIPLVELVAGRETRPGAVELVKGWLRAMDRIPVVIRRQVPGAVATRIAAAVWREAIHLVLEGVIDMDDLDRAVSVGPGLGWAAAGPHLSYRLAAGDRRTAGFLQHLLSTFEPIWEDLADWSRLEPEQQRRLIHLIDRTYEEQIGMIRSARDKRLAAILWGLERSKDTEL